MKFSKSKWFIYTLLVGLIPILIRLLVWFVVTTNQVEPISAIELVTFGLVIHASVINEAEHLPAKDHEWKSALNGQAITFITLYGALYALAAFGDKVDGAVEADAIEEIAISLSSMSILLAIMNLHHFSTRSKR
ncbi:hypothetical protein GM658_11540 [Pseudoduganella eburnea]|uniref:Uncharacterized protein n=2 Tax=Massilia eburnea TaxID=1776165 RepID=A0A6L6QG50_9BURK|nr:hypothetical protein [Massilia eburnea]